MIEALLGRSILPAPFDILPRSPCSLLLPPLAWHVEDTNFLKSGYRDIPPPGAGPYICV